MMTIETLERLNNIHTSVNNIKEELNHAENYISNNRLLSSSFTPVKVSGNSNYVFQIPTQRIVELVELHASNLEEQVEKLLEEADKLVKGEQND